MRVLVVENSPGSPVGQLGPWLEADGVAVDLHRGREGLPDSLDGYYGLIRLGGSAVRRADPGAGGHRRVGALRWEMHGLRTVSTRSGPTQLRLDQGWGPYGFDATNGSADERASWFWAIN